MPDVALPTAAATPDDERFIDDYLLYLLARASHVASAQFHDRLAGRGVPVPVWRVLAVLSGTPGLTVGELAKGVLYKQPTLTKVVDRMAADGLVERVPGEGDRRTVLVRSTPKGDALVADLLVAAKEHERSILAAYSREEARTLKQVLRTLIARNDRAAD
ncbi:MAG TPA: MarR family transcriptional regulator [Azospirillum sp.]|nr:MarR family transcriptional regulator [Azospirillum sp.]